MRFWRSAQDSKIGIAFVKFRKLSSKSTRRWGMVQSSVVGWVGSARTAESTERVIVARSVVCILKKVVKECELEWA